MNKTKGSVLVQVLMTAVIVSIIAAGMMNLMLMRAQAVKHAQDGAAGAAKTNMGLNAIISGWGTAGGQNCSTVPGYSGGGGASVGTCNCTYTSLDGTNTTVCAGTGCTPALSTNPCKLAIVGTVWPPPP